MADDAQLAAMVQAIRGRGISLWPDEDESTLWCDNMAGLTAGEAQFVRQNAGEILAYLRHRNEQLLPSKTICDQWRKKHCHVKNPL
jgi:hypothetical protein